MKRIMIILFIILLIMVPNITFAADTCDPTSVKIESIELNDTRGNIEENNTPTSNDNELNIDLNMNVPGDSIEYKLTLKNTSDTDYYFDENSLVKNMDNVEYEFSYSDGDNIVKSGEEKIVILKVTYKDKVAAEQLNNGTVTQNNVVTINLTNNNINIPDTLKNGSLVLIFGITLLIIAGILMIFEQRKSSLLLMMIAIGIQLIPLTVNALCKCELNVNSKIEIDGKDAMFLPGQDLNIKMKQLAGNDTSTVTNPTSFKDSLITSFKYSSAEPSEANKQNENIVSTPESDYPIYMWFDNGTMYWWSEDKTPSLNDNASYMFYYINNLNDLEGVELFDLSTSTNLFSMFGDSSIQNLDSLEKWNVSKITNMGFIFASCRQLTDMKGIKNWDVTNVESMAGLFNSCTELEEIDLSNWDTRSLTNIQSMFLMASPRNVVGSGKIKRIILSDKFDTSKVNNFSLLIAGNSEIEDFNFLRQLDTSSATYFSGTFANTNFADTTYISNWRTPKLTVLESTFANTNITSFDGLENWDVSNVFTFNRAFNGLSISSFEPIYNWNTAGASTFEYTFANCRNVTELDLSKWKPTNLTSISNMFSGMSNLEELDISGLDTKNVTNFTRLFNGSSKLKHIYVGENWNTEANTGDTTEVFPTSSELRNFNNTNTNYRDLIYAHYGEGGYLTLKSN